MCALICCNLALCRRRHTSASVIGREEFAQQIRIAAELLLASKEQKVRRFASAGCSFTAQQPLLQVPPQMLAPKSPHVLHT